MVYEKCSILKGIKHYLRNTMLMTNWAVYHYYSLKEKDDIIDQFAKTKLQKKLEHWKCI